MSNPFLRSIIRTRFALTSRASVAAQTETVLKNYLRLAQGLDETTGSEPVTVPRMPGIGADMRGWSFFMILRHNVIVNREISATVRRLALDEPPPERKFDVKKDVMPHPDCGIEQIAIFKSSVLDHLEQTAKLPGLKNTAITDHPLFGPFNAHKWNCMFAFHLQIHLKQATFVRQAVLQDVKPRRP